MFCNFSISCGFYNNFYRLPSVICRLPTVQHFPLIRKQGGCLPQLIGNYSA
ncbi:hypothetical protein KsCSTR_01670 [Candidatus Kuenenia stuttgartiensis]|uniref:Uncharacterized protein n=1 Tax=Kuenenia stuttgartiensis TaxID=174633 RepID=Q1PUX9_KUEST|nr:hypothetical protein KsCSTR_01670 [Candidatus Kuenenia stuttgartiensis]CAJ71035.1 unknown protein [Candidatus Kuenenia stuttgartiensis]